MISVSHLNYEYSGRRALKDVSFRIPEGAVTALVGPNGAGKTTLLKCLAALTRPFSGGIEINGVDVLKHPRTCHEFMGFLPDFFGLYDALTVRQSLAYFAGAQKVPADRIASRVREVAEMVDLADRLDEKVGRLSRGMRQRLGIGQAMIHDPMVLLLDEPASGLDPGARHRLSEMFLGLKAKGKTLVVSSHILSELDQYATEMLVLREGGLVETPPVGAVPRRHPLCVRVSAVPENMAAVLENAPGETTLAGIDGTLITLGFSGNPADQHPLLAHLIRSGVPVTEFFMKREGLQERYLERVTE